MPPCIPKTIIALMLIMPGAAPAHAACNQKTVYGAFVNRYIFQDSGFMGYDDPVFQGGVTLNCESGWWFDLFNSSGLSTEGSYGQLDDRQYADEFDFTAAKSAEIGSPIGTLQYQLFASYYLLSDFNHASDDLVEIHGQLARAFVLPTPAKNITLSPYVRTIGFIGLGVYPDSMLIRPGIKGAIKLSEKITFNTNLAIGFDPEAGTEIFRSDTGFDLHLGNGLTMTTEWQTAEGVKSAAMIGFSRSF